MHRSTVQAATSGNPWRRRYAVIFRRPYSPSGVSRRRPWESVVKLASKMALITIASPTVRAAGCLAARQAR
jgi:hypothetical protein